MEEFPSLVVRKKPFLAPLTSIYHLYFLSQIIGSSGKSKKRKLNDISMNERKIYKFMIMTRGKKERHYSIGLKIFQCWKIVLN
jgi:hypothetical protein